MKHLLCRQWWKSWHHENCWFLVTRHLEISALKFARLLQFVVILASLCVASYTLWSPYINVILWSLGWKRYIHTGVIYLFVINKLTNFIEILTETDTFSLWKIPFKMSSGKWRPFCISLNMLLKHPGYKIESTWRLVSIGYDSYLQKLIIS